MKCLSCLTNKVKYIIDTIVNLEPNENLETGSVSKESIVQKIVVDKLDKIPAYYVEHEVIKFWF